MPRIHCPEALHSGQSLALPPGAARHVQVLRMQPGEVLTLFDGRGGEYGATIERMGRSEVTVQIGAHDLVEREAPREVHLAIGMPANERMDWLVEKAAELGVASIQPLVTAHGVLRLAGERAEKKRAHWQAVVVAACEQCGRNRVPQVDLPQGLDAWLAAQAGAEAARVVEPGGAAPDTLRLLLSFGSDSQPLAQRVAAASGAPGAGAIYVLSGPEGGLNPQEEAAARAQGYLPVALGPRVLRAETAALAALMGLQALADG